MEHIKERKLFLAMCLVRMFEKRVTSPDPVSVWAAKSWQVELWIKVSKMGGSTFFFRFSCEAEAVRVLREGERWTDDNFLSLHRWSEGIVLDVQRRRGVKSGEYGGFDIASLG